MKYQKDYYQILGVKPDATLEEIRSAYRRLVILNHPDRNPSSQTTARMQEINEAYDVIGDQNKRTRYDFEYLNSTTTSQTKESFSEETANLQEFSDEQKLMLLAPGTWIAFFLLVGAIGEIMVMSLLRIFPILAYWYTKEPVAQMLMLLVGPLVAFGITGVIAFWISSKRSEKENQCPQCGKVWAAEELSEKLMGIFQKAYEVSNRGASYMRHSKYRIHYKCKYCSYEWLFIKVKKI